MLGKKDPGSVSGGRARKAPGVKQVRDEDNLCQGPVTQQLGFCFLTISDLVLGNFEPPHGQY